VAIVAGTKTETVIEVLRKLPESHRKKVKEITLDMADNMAPVPMPRLSHSTMRRAVQDQSLQKSVETVRNVEFFFIDFLDYMLDAIPNRRYIQ